MAGHGPWPLVGEQGARGPPAVRFGCYAPAPGRAKPLVVPPVEEGVPAMRER